MLFHRVKMLAAVLVAGIAVSCAPPVAGTRINAGSEVDGTLAAQTDATKANEPVQALYALTGRKDETYVVTLASTAFDSYLQVRGPGSLAQENDDDTSGATTLNSRLTFTFPEDGTAQIVVTSFDRRGVGAYRLGVQRVEAPVVAAATGAAAVVGQNINGELAQGDAQLGTGEFTDTYPLTGAQGQQLDIQLSSTAFDPYVAITGPNGFREFNDDDVQAGSRNSRLIVALPAAGQYTVHVTSYQPGERGAYQLSINPTDQVAAAPGLAGTANAADLGLGQTMQGQLAQGDSTLRSGEFVDTYRFAGQAGQRVSIEMTSTAFDSYLMLVAPSGAQEDNDDGVQGQPNARLETTLTESGQYAIAATSYRPGESGAYTVTLRQGEAAAQIAANAGTARRVFAVMVGISDYPGAGNDLPFTAEDARKMQQTLLRNGVLAQESAVLIDGQATRASVRAAFQRVAAAAGPDDLFLFFYSGHGSQVRATASATEPDAKDETIELYDGAMRDDELAQMFQQQVRARTALLVLDSCFSGGFARDVVSHPGVMGLFSSEEDLTSAVADKFQAGGYLSHFIQTGLSGGADENRDRVVTAGELSAWVRRQFASEARDVSSSTMAGGRNYQFPVVDRGGVDVDSPLLAIRT